MDERKDVADLDSTERDNFVNALLDLKKLPSRTGAAGGWPQPKNRYDDFVLMHMMSFNREDPLSMIAHRTPTFLPWHRAYLRLFERELQRIPNKPEYANVTIPYWDWTSTQSNEAIWDEELMGGDGREEDWRVMSGKFAFDSGNWVLFTTEDVHPAYERQDLRRKFGYYVEDGVQYEVELPTVDHVNEALEENPYDSPQWDGVAQPSFRNILEGGYGDGSIHNIVHPWVGGMIVQNGRISDCGAMSYGGSPNDPCFWLHHSNIDRLWADWQLDEDHWNLNYKGYLPVNGGPAGLNVNDPMLPWSRPITPASVADFYRIDNKGYKYKKYFRDHIKDREEALELEDRAISPAIKDEIFDVNFGLLKGSFDDLKRRLGAPLFPFRPGPRK